MAAERHVRTSRCPHLALVWKSSRFAIRSHISFARIFNAIHEIFKNGGHILHSNEALPHSAIKLGESPPILRIFRHHFYIYHLQQLTFD